MKKVNPFRIATYVLNAHELKQLPKDQGMEVAIAGRSNAGKSSAINTLTDQKSLAGTSGGNVSLYVLLPSCQLPCES